MKVELARPDKVLWPQGGFTKADLWRYVERVADRLLSQVAGRPLTLKRFPDGLDGEGFFQKNLPDRAPDWLPRFRVWTPSSRRHVTYLVAGDVDHLRWMADQAALEFHPWFSRTDRPQRPDLLVFDLDPAEGMGSAVQAAWWLKAMLDEAGLASLVKTSGKRGLHVYVPIERRYSFDEVRDFGLAVARCCADRHPGKLTVEVPKGQRKGRLLVDWTRNGRAQTLVAAWSPRAHPAATVSMPLDWDEVGSALDPTAFTLDTAPGRPDAWADPPRAQRIEKARRALSEAGYPS
ncbi:MAG TPA: non-homologous end-joining DNA ligase [Egibacteraceae bacterium]|nr:non-homologous end-joining DNA ligase [Actinomycetota bacterium]HWB71745.1 non-homologous end-joining DNA ligase [Egibacteraceae bacterium]